MTSKTNMDAQIAALDKQMKSSSFQPEQLKDSPNKDRPPCLIPPPKEQRAHVLMLDNELDFLKQIELAWQEYYPDSFYLHCLHLDDQIKSADDAIQKIEELAVKLKQPLCLFIDRHHKSFAMQDLLKKIYQHSSIRYFPVSFMTANPGRLEELDELIYAEGLRILYSKRSSAYFLYECATIIEQLKSEVEERKWADLRDQLAENIADNLSTKEVLRHFQDFLEQHLDVSLCVIRELKANKTLEWYAEPNPDTSDIKIFPKELPADKIPFYREILNNTHAIRKESLSKADVGVDGFKSESFRLLAIQLRYQNETLGTLCLFRQPDKPIFRYQDEHRLLPAAMELSVYLGQQKNQRELNKRQQDFLHFVEKIDNTGNEQDILDLLAKHLHERIHHYNDEHSKTTIRLLAAGTGDLIRRVCLGLKPMDVKITVYTENSTYAHAVMTGKTVRHCNSDKERCFISTQKDIHSCMVVPLLAGELPLGAVNLEHSKPNFYTDNDQIYAESLCRIAANALFRLRADKFKSGLVRLIRDINNPDRDISPLIDELLFLYFRYSRLLELKPGASVKSPWLVVRGVQANQEDTLEYFDNNQIQDWQQNIAQDWEKTYVKKTIFRESTHKTFTKEEFTRELVVDFNTQSEAVILLQDKEEILSQRAIMLLFRVKNALNKEQITLLEEIGQLLSTLYRHQRNTHGYFIQAQIRDTEELQAKAAQQMRHGMTNYLGGMTNLLDEFEVEELTADKKDKYIKVMRKTLKRIFQDMREYQNLTKPLPKLENENIAEIWQNSKESLKHHAFFVDHQVTINDLSKPIAWRVDKNYLKSIFDSLLQNALESGDDLKEINLEYQEQENRLILTISNNGNPISAEVLPKLFTLGNTTKKSGTGFGLYNCRYLMHKMHGEIYYRYDEKRKYVCFDLYLPKIEKT